MGTHTLEKVSYQLLGDTMPYKLQFRCRRSPLNELGASARFDALDFASLLVHGGIGTRRLTGHRFDLILRLGLNTKAELSYTYRSGHSMDFGGILSFQALREGGVRDKSHRLSIDFNRYRLDAFMAFLPFKQMRMQTGIRMDAFYRVSMLSDTNIDFSTIHESDIWPVFYALMRSDSFDDAYFPTNGIQFMGFYSWTPGGIRHDGPGVHTWHTSFHAAMSSEGVTLLPFFEARYVSATVMPYVNILAVSNANRCLDQQIVFMGINTAHSAMRTLLTAGFNLRRPIGSRHNIIAGMQVLHHAPDIKSFDAPQLSETCWGISLEYAYNSIIGPMRFNVHWSDMAKKLGFYLGIGLDF